MFRMSRFFLLPVVLVTLVTTVCAQRPLTPGARYKLHLGDQLTIHFPLSPEFDQPVTIQPDGFVVLTLGGEARIVGLTLPEATKLINEHATARLKDPDAQITLTDFQHPYFVVAGEVNAPNRYDLRQEMTALQALMIAGGARISGKETQVVLIHGAETGSPTIRILDMKHLTPKNVADTPLVVSGDIVFVPRNKITNAQQVAGLFAPLAGYAAPAATIAVH